eukprot:bmy_10032T0
MVFLTAQLWLRNRITDRYWRVQEVLKHARHFRGRKNRCYRLAVRAVTRAFVQCTRARRLKKRNLRTLWISRVTAASQEHGLKYGRGCGPAETLNVFITRPVAVVQQRGQWSVRSPTLLSFLEWGSGGFGDSPHWLCRCPAGSGIGNRLGGMGPCARPCVWHSTKILGCQVELNRKVLADLAIYEPKTFKSLAALAKRRRQEGFAAALGDGKEPEGVFSRVAQHL